MRKEWQLSGTADSEKYRVEDSDGNKRPPEDAIVAIMRQERNGDWVGVGTGFFITTFGLIVSANHVLRDSFDREGNCEAAMGIIQLAPDNEFYIRSLILGSSNSFTDLGIALVAPMNHNDTKKPLKNKCLIMTSKQLAEGDHLHTYAFPNIKVEKKEKTEVKLAPAFFEGEVLKCYPDGRDKVLLPGPCYETSMHIHGGASGAPVFNSNGLVCGINSTSIDSGEPDISYVSFIDGLMELKMSGLCLEEDLDPREYTISQLIDLGLVPFKD